MQRTDLIAALLLVTGLCIVPAITHANDDLSPAEARGKHIYTQGESTSSRVITAAIQMSESPASASILPCTQCHGTDGRGIGIVAPAVNWDVLTDPAAHKHPLREHVPFDEASLARAVREGVDPGGNDLEATMPRYKMTDADMADLIAYLKRVGTELDPGLSATTIRIGTVLPTDGPLAGIGNAIRQVIEAVFDDVNDEGGVHGRRLELVVGEYGAENTPAFWDAQDLVSSEPLFAMLASYLPEYEAEMSGLINEKRIPHIGPYNLLTNDSGGRYEFFVQPSIVEQAHALIKSTVVDGNRPRIAIVYPLIKGFDGLVASARDVATAAMFPKIVDAPYRLNAFDAAGIIRRLGANDVESVVFLGSAREFLEFARMADSQDWRPDLLAPALFAERVALEVPAAFDGRVFLAYPALPGDRTEEGISSFESLHREHGIDYANSVAQIAAFSAVRVLVEGLQKSNSKLGRERLIEALERFDDYEPGLAPPISYSADRRVGALGAHVVQVDLAAGRLDGQQRWISLASANKSTAN